MQHRELKLELFRRIHFQEKKNACGMHHREPRLEISRIGHFPQKKGACGVHHRAQQLDFSGIASFLDAIKRLRHAPHHEHVQTYALHTHRNTQNSFRNTSQTTPNEHVCFHENSNILTQVITNNNTEICSCRCVCGFHTLPTAPKSHQLAHLTRSNWR